MQNSLAVANLPNNPIEKLSAHAKPFYTFHGVQMIGSQFPPSLIETLYLKLVDSSYDGGSYFQILDNQDDQTFEVRATQNIAANSNVFLVDHALTFRYPELRKLLKDNPKVIDRLQNMLKYHQEKNLPDSENQTVEEQPLSLQLDNMDMLQLGAIELPKELITLSLTNNRLENAQQLISKLQYLNLRALWLDGNPVADNQDLRKYVQTRTRIELFNGKFTNNTSDWGVKLAHSKSVNFANNNDKHSIFTLNLDDRNVFALDIGILQGFSKLRSLSIKSHTISDKEDIQKIIRIANIPTLTFLFVDEAVEIQIRQAVARGEISQKVKQRLLVNKHSLRQQLVEGDLKTDQILDKIYRVAGCYRLASSQKLDQSSCWYINDELGSSISHSDHPNVKLIPFLYAPANKLDENVIAYSILWPLEDIKAGDLITRDYLNGIREQRQRSSRLAAWYKLPQQGYLSKIDQYDRKMFELTKDSVSLMQKFYNQNALLQRQHISRQLQWVEKYAVITDYEYINKYLKHQRFQIVSDLEKASIVWLVGAAEEQEWNKYKGKYYLNQFPYESCIVLKHNLANTIQTVFGDTKFLMRTYDLQKQLPLFIGDYYRRQKQGLQNLWILKPPNMARSMDMIITDNLPLIIRAMETGPKIAQKYISKPVLRRGRKVDLRYILLVKSVAPLTLFLYKNFWIRSANNPYSVDRRHLCTYQTQFTVMNYGNVSNFQQIKYKDFIEQFEKDYSVKWSTINEKIKKMLRNVFIAVATKYPQMHDDKSRAVYGIDVMIDSQTMEPKLLEITFSPDCKRACEYYPTFYDEVFQTLFLESMSQNMQRII